MDPRSDYPLGSMRPDLVETPGGHRLDDITLEAAREGAITGLEIRATPETLQRQAEIARASGRAPLAENLVRAAELARVPDDELLAIYTALRPHRSTAGRARGARPCGSRAGARPRTAAFVREARRGLRRARPPCRLSARTRFGARAERELRRELIISPMPELGLVAANGPDDPEPELVVADGVVAPDGRPRRGRLRRHRPLPRRARPRPRGRGRGDGAARPRARPQARRHRRAARRAGAAGARAHAGQARAGRRHRSTRSS